MNFSVLHTCAFVIVNFLLISINFITAQHSPEIIAHRGAKSLAPENTISAFAAAIDMGVDYIELDVRKSLDDSLMVMHDSTVNRTTNFSGGLNTFTYAQLKNMDAGSYFSNNFTGEEIPTLYEVLHFAKGKTKICIELKDPNIEVQAVNLIQQMNLVNDVVLFSFDLNQLQLIKLINPAIKVCYLQHLISLNDIDDLININGEYVGSGGDPPMSSILYANYFGIDFWKWTINSTEEMKHRMTQGINGIITDYPQDLICLKTLFMNHGLIASWHFDNNVGNLIDDESGNLNNGTTYNTNWSNGLNGSSLSFNGSSSYASFNHSSAFNTVFKEASISVWVNLNQLPSSISNSFGPIFDSDQDAYILYLDKANAELRFKVKDINGNAERPGIPESYLSTGNWHHVAGVCNNEDVLIYLDGMLIDNHTNQALDTLIQNQIAEIGRNNGNYFNGKLDELKIFNRALTPVEVEMLYQQSSYFCTDTTQVILPLDSFISPVSSDLASCDSIELNFNIQKNINTSLHFEGISDYININSTAPDLANYSHSFFSWIKAPTAILNQRIFSINTHNGNNRSLFGIYNNKMNLYHDGNYYSGITTITDGLWHYVGYSWNNNTKVLRIFVDGFTDGIFTNIDLKSSKTDLISLGQEFDGLTASNVYKGEMMHISVWKNAITIAEQFDMYHNGITPSHPKYIYLVGHYLGQTNCTNQLQDFSMYQHHGLSYPKLKLKYDTITNYDFSNTSHQWTTLGGLLLGDSNIVHSTLFGTDQIIYNQTNITGQTFTDTFQVSVHVPNQIDLGLDTSVCLGENFYIQPDTTYLSYLWNNNSSSNQFYFESNLYGVGNHTVFVNATDQNNCEVNDTLQIEVIDCSSIIETNKNDIIIYPNPVEGQIHLRIPENDKLTEVNFFTIDGKFIQKSYSGTIDVSTFKAGVYIIEVNTINFSKPQKIKIIKK